MANSLSDIFNTHNLNIRCLVSTHIGSYALILYVFLIISAYVASKEYSSRSWFSSIPEVLVVQSVSNTFSAEDQNN